MNEQKKTGQGRGVCTPSVSLSRCLEILCTRGMEGTFLPPCGQRICCLLVVPVAERTKGVLACYLSCQCGSLPISSCVAAWKGCDCKNDYKHQENGCPVKHPAVRLLPVCLNIISTLYTAPLCDIYSHNLLAAWAPDLQQNTTPVECPRWIDPLYPVSVTKVVRDGLRLE